MTAGKFSVLGLSVAWVGLSGSRASPVTGHLSIPRPGNQIVPKQPEDKDHIRRLNGT